MEEEFSPGTIVCNTQSYFPRRMPVWGIVLPKESFLKLFQKEKGPWPTGEVYYDGSNYNDLIHNKFGGYLPTETSNELEPKRVIQKILPPEYFLNNTRHIGTKCFGEIYSPNDKRQISLEIMDKQSHVIPFNLKNLKLIDIVRKYTLEETACNPHHTKGVAFDMGFIVKYFSGEFKGEQLDKIHYSKGPDAAKLIEMLRFCGFKEENIFDKDIPTDLSSLLY